MYRAARAAKELGFAAHGRELCDRGLEAASGANDAQRAMFRSLLQEFNAVPVHFPPRRPVLRRPDGTFPALDSDCQGEATAEGEWWLLNAALNADLSWRFGYEQETWPGTWPGTYYEVLLGGASYNGVERLAVIMDGTSQVVGLPTAFPNVRALVLDDSLNCLRYCYNLGGGVRDGMGTDGSAGGGGYAIPWPAQRLFLTTRMGALKGVRGGRRTPIGRIRSSQHFSAVAPNEHGTSASGG